MLVAPGGPVPPAPLAAMSIAPPSLAELQPRLEALTLRDERRLRRRLGEARRGGPQALAELAREVEAAERVVAARRAAAPTVRYPAELPITARRDELAATIGDHQVVIVAGETGSGKSTQLPKLCLELGRGVRGLVGHTQPRRPGRPLGGRTGGRGAGHHGGRGPSATRCASPDRVGDGTLVKLMTDGILLAEIQRDRTLSAYDTLIIDEAHERSLNIDFILGYLTRLLPERPDLKVIVTSATIDTERFSRHFADAPVVQVSGRAHPVEIRYRPVGDDGPDGGGGGGGGSRGGGGGGDRDQVQAICDAVRELGAEGPGDVLVFLSGEREIRDTADALARLGLRDTELLPLYARLSAAEQHRVFQPHRGRRIVLATNVAETSLTVPGIRYVVDPGTARISRYSRRTKVQRLPIEAISQASADQRAGRCGRVGPGTCIRLYAEDDYLGRPEFTEPEILRTNLASVILQMTAIGFGDVAAFPFVDPPDARSIGDGIALLEELGALDPSAPDARRRLTPLGRSLARLPVDPRLGRMVLEAERNGCPTEVMVIAAALSIQDPRERPADQREAAAQHHARFVDPESDFLTYLNLLALPAGAPGRAVLQPVPPAVQGRAPAPPAGAGVAGTWWASCGWWPAAWASAPTASPATATASTCRCWPGCCPTSACARPTAPTGGATPAAGATAAGAGRRPEYLGARNARFAVSRDSALAKTPPRWVVAAELVETNRLWARVVAGIQPAWAEKAGAHLVKRSYSEPRWDPRPGRGGGPGAGDALRRARGGLAAGELRPHRPRGGPPAVHPPRPRGRRVAGAPRLRGPQRRAGGRGARPRAPGPGATCWWTTRPASTSSTPACRPTWCPPATSTSGGATSASAGPRCSPTAATTWCAPAPPPSTPTPSPTCGARAS